ncbi:hypothetical protein B0H12DRAFT_1148135 [Mycena haematopus]|nr:hypothetical protein B0H12DRAFT_1148135 [Mycena haematopus]
MTWYDFSMENPREVFGSAQMTDLPNEYSNSLSKVTTRKPAELKMSPILVLTVNTFGTTETTAISFGFWLNQNII